MPRNGCHWWCERRALTHSFWSPRKRGREEVSLCVSYAKRLITVSCKYIFSCVKMPTMISFLWRMLDAVRFDWALWALWAPSIFHVRIFVARSLGILRHRKVCPIGEHVASAATNEYSNMRAGDNDQNIAQTQFTTIFICTKMPEHKAHLRLGAYVSTEEHLLFDTRA